MKGIGEGELEGTHNMADRGNNRLIRLFMKSLKPTCKTPSAPNGANRYCILCAFCKFVTDTRIHGWTDRQDKDNALSKN